MSEQFERVRAAIKRIENAVDAYLADEASAEKLDAAEEAQRDFGCNNWDDVRDLLSRLEKLESIAGTLFCSYCGDKNAAPVGKTREETIENCRKHMAVCEKRPELPLVRALNSIAIALGLEVWDDLPRGDTDALLEAVERAMNSRTLAAFKRGLEAARVSLGADPVDLSLDLDQLFADWMKPHREKYNSGARLAIMGAELFRDFLKERKFQMGAPR